MQLIWFHGFIEALTGQLVITQRGVVTGIVAVNGFAGMSLTKKLQIMAILGIMFIMFRKKIPIIGVSTTNLCVMLIGLKRSNQDGCGILNLLKLIKVIGDLQTFGINVIKFL